MFYHADKFRRQRPVLNYYIAEQRLISRWREWSSDLHATQKV